MAKSPKHRLKQHDKVLLAADSDEVGQVLRFISDTCYD